MQACKTTITTYHFTIDTTAKANDRPISPLPILGKMFEKIIFDFLYEYFINNKLLTSCQSGFIKGDSCVNQLVAITHEIHKNLDVNPSIDTIGVFLDMSKAFDKVWHGGLIFKLKSYGIQSQLLVLLSSMEEGLNDTKISASTHHP